MSFPSPPGLETPEFAAAANGMQITEAAKREVRAAALKSAEEQISQLGDNVDCQAIIEAIREVVLQDVDAKLAEKAEELWQRGKQMLNNTFQKHKEKTNKLTEEMTKCIERQHVLEAENEKLKQVIQHLAARFNMLGAVFAGKEGAAGAVDAAAARGTSTASTASPPQTKESGSEPFTPAPFTPLSSEAQAAVAEAAMLAGGPAPGLKLPEVPPFPFPSQPSTPAAPLLLSEALGAQTPQRTPLSLVNSLTTTPTPEAPSPFATRSAPAGSGIFSFTLRKADGADLGLNVSHQQSDQVLYVEGVRPEGAIEAWNRQCAGSAAAEKAVMVGDRIISVNSVVYDPVKMLEECRDKQLLKLVIMRGERPLPAMPGIAAKAPPPNTVIATPGAVVEASPSSKSTALRADASVFVPMGAESSSTTAGQQQEENDGEDAEPRSETDAAVAAEEGSKGADAVRDRV